MSTKTRLTAAAALLVVLGTAAGAQEFPLAPLVARLPGGTRALAMANADAGGRTSDVIFYNPGQLSVAGGTSGSAEFYTGANLLVTVSTVLDFGPGAIGVGVQSLTFSNTNPAEAAPDVLGTSGVFPSSGLILALGYAQPLFGMRAGVNAKLLEQSIGNNRDSRGSLDFGLSRDLLRGTLGFTVQNVGPAFRGVAGRVSQPTRTSLGFTSGRYMAGPFDLYGAATTSLLRGRDVVAGGGGEISYSWLDGYAVAFRGGLRRPAAGEGPWTLGFGISADRVSLDYAFESRDHRHGAHRVGVRIR
jgi:hypothetical protein